VRCFALQLLQQRVDFRPDLRIKPGRRFVGKMSCGSFTRARARASRCFLTSRKACRKGVPLFFELQNASVVGRDSRCGCRRMRTRPWFVNAIFSASSSPAGIRRCRSLSRWRCCRDETRTRLDHPWRGRSLRSPSSSCRAVRSEQSEHFPRLDFEVDSLHGFYLAVDS